MTNADPNREAQLKPARETDEAYFARLKEAAHRIMDFHETDDDVKNPDYVEGFENGYIKAFHTLSETCDVFTFANEGANRFYDDGFRAALNYTEAGSTTVTGKPLKSPLVNVSRRVMP